MDNAATNFEGWSRWMVTLFRPDGVVTGLNVVQRNGGANMSVDIQPGDVMPFYDPGDFTPSNTGKVPYSWNTAAYNIAIGAASANNRRDIVVAYVDLAVTNPSTATPNNPGALKFMVVQGTPGSSPSDPSDLTIQAAVGASNLFTKLARVSLTSSTTQITNAQITDIRRFVALNVQRLWGGNNNNLGHLVPNQADGTIVTTSDTGSVSNQMLAVSAITLGHAQSTTPHNTGAVTSMVDVSGLSITVTVPAGMTRRLEIEGWISSVFNASGTGTNTQLAIREGSTVLSYADIALPNNDLRKMGSVKYSAVVSAGTHTYKLSTQNTIATNVQYQQSATNPGFITAKLV
jgi:hypothetical protein